MYDHKLFSIYVNFSCDTKIMLRKYLMILSIRVCKFCLQESHPKYFSGWTCQSYCPSGVQSQPALSWAQLCNCKCHLQLHSCAQRQWLPKHLPLGFALSTTAIRILRTTRRKEEAKWAEPRCPIGPADNQLTPDTRKSQDQQDWANHPHAVS